MDEGTGIWRWAGVGLEVVEGRPVSGDVDLVGLVANHPELVGEGVQWSGASDEVLSPTLRWANEGARTLLVVVVPVVTPDRLFRVLAQVQQACHGRGTEASDVHVRLVIGHIPQDVVEGLYYLQSVAPSLQVHRLVMAAVGGETVILRTGLPAPEVEAECDSVEWESEPDVESTHEEETQTEQEAEGSVADAPDVPESPAPGAGETVETLGDQYSFLGKVGDADVRHLARRWRVVMRYGLYKALANKGLVRADSLAVATREDISSALGTQELRTQLDELLNGLAFVLDPDVEAESGAEPCEGTEGQSAPDERAEGVETQGDLREPAVEPAHDEPTDVVETTAEGPTAHQLVSDWLEALPRGEAHVLLAACFPPTASVTKVSTATLGSERLTQDRLRADFAWQVDSEGWAVVRNEIRSLQRRLGPWVPVGRCPANLGDPVVRVMLDNAGYHARQERVGRVLTLGSSAVPGRAQLPRMRASDLVLISRSAWAMLETAGLRRDVIELYLENLGFTEVEGHWVEQPDSASEVDRAVARLAVRGGPMSPVALAAAVGAGDARGLARDMVSDPRVREMGDRGLALRAWGEGESDWIAGLIKREIAARGGQARQEELVAAVADRHDVKQEKVAAHALAPMFVRRSGTIRVRRSNEKWTFPHYTAVDSSVRKGPRGMLVWTVPVNSELLRGANRQVPMAAAKVLALQPGSTMAFTGTGNLSRFTLMTTWRWSSHTGAWLGRLGPVARALGTQEGESVELTFSPRRSTFMARVVRD